MPVNQMPVADGATHPPRSYQYRPARGLQRADHRHGPDPPPERRRNAHQTDRATPTRPTAQRPPDRQRNAHGSNRYFVQPFCPDFSVAHAFASPASFTATIGV
ncbi:hypothetical protein GCM10023335_64480 [Streptomyces siamensis]|uniref:Uncharacterized protein n=1 Tax=Streptomyces siamensis TaxID=1274986 RepID=A0ABP9JC92_9ACTN